MEKERKITAPEGCEIEKVELVDGVAVVTFREKERKLPKTWEEFCKIIAWMFGLPPHCVDIQDNLKFNTFMEKERKITAPEGCEIEKAELVDGVAVVTFREKERKLPKTWEEFCKMFPIKDGECYIENYCNIIDDRWPQSKLKDRNVFPDSATAEAVLALCQLIHLRNAYNGDWVPDYMTADTKFTIEFENNRIVNNTTKRWPCILVFKSEDLCEKFLHNFRDLIEKLKPLYGIKEGGEE